MNQRMKSSDNDPLIMNCLKKDLEAAIKPFSFAFGPSLEQDPRVLVANIMERYKEHWTPKAPNQASASVMVDRKPQEGRRVIAADPSREPSVMFMTSSTSGGHVTNVAGDYITNDVDDEQLVARMRNASALEKLTYATGASWNPRRACLSGTRVTTLALIHDWLWSLDSRNIFHLKGVAGSGKTAIAHAIAQALHKDGRLASAFFFDREDPARNTPRFLLTTIARDIANLYPAIAAEISNALVKEPALVSAHISRQFEAFIAGPLRRHPVDSPIMLVIDALDEGICDDSDTDLLEILRDGVAELPSHVRIFITSRPTKVIEQYLSGKSHATSHLLDIDSHENRQDIAAYVDSQLLDDTIWSQMGTPWPDEELIRDLKIMAEGLFLWIATVFGYLRNAHKPRAKLRALLSKSHPQGELEPTKKIDKLYAAILEVSGDWDDIDFCEDYALFMGAVMAVKRPLSLATLRALHGGNEELSLKRLPQRFGSVLVGLHEEYAPIHTLHLSFREFITDRASKSPYTHKFYVSETLHSQRLAELCLQTMVRELGSTTIPGAGYLTGDNVDNLDEGIPKLSGISEHLLYACEYWGDHISDVETPNSSISEIVPQFLPHHNIIWIEIVASNSTFRGSLCVWHWLNGHGIIFKDLYDVDSQARALFGLSSRLAYIGQLSEAAIAMQEAVDLHRTLVAEQPAIHYTKLAQSLNNLSNRLSDLGKKEEALKTVEEAVILRRVFTLEGSGKFIDSLAQSLNNFSNRLSDVGRITEALIAAHEAVALYRQLAAERPAEFNAHLATSLNSLSNHLSNLGQGEDALSAIQESVTLRQALAVGKPVACNANLALSLNNLSAHLSRLGRREEALVWIQEAECLYRALAAEQPEKYNAYLAGSLLNLSRTFLELGRQGEALVPIRESVALYRALAGKRAALYNVNLKNALANLVLVLLNIGNQEETREVVREFTSLPM
ncbi:hypothetical protein HWV62_43965 [Athelia sp. TMB]|nr:hypothetical protein HWV62_43965 [Athelia sp. TMB]